MRELESQVEKALGESMSRDVRWVDQKVTYDNLYLIARTVLVAVRDKGQWFDRFFLENSKSLQKEIERTYGKPAVNDLDARNEYDKFFGQPLNALAYAGILNTRMEKRTRKYQVRDEELLNFIGSSSDRARQYLIKYLEQALKAQGFWPQMKQYLKSDQTDKDYRILKSNFQTFMLEHSLIGTRGSKDPRVEINRIFPKVVNPICFDRGALGSEHGRVMKTIPSNFDLIYNRPNFRDKKSGKPKHMARSAYASLLEQQSIKQPATSAMTSLMKKVRTYQKEVSEYYPANGMRATHVHHIFPKSKFSSISDVPENLIVLTPGQHLGEAHPNGNTQVVDLAVQKVLLFSKLQSIKNSVDAGDGFYSYERFAKVLEEGYQIIPKTIDAAGCREAIAQKLV
ncbi:hypothetical protein CS176_1129 [Corynebacterium glutamicum]|uniref:hypothetical protein n=1 Tax=Corynebacterium glutamicum TaxID=1718 RepID=UPI00097B3E0B|nr:hypothetical protein [Corynebacterium glutamicum]GAV96899.1 hypothetical protein CS176_1129 [Corynebacterium glutamicum]